MFSRAFLAVSVASSLLIGGCATAPEQPAADKAAPAAKTATQKSVELYEVVHDGRIYVFYDLKDYRSFLKHMEAPYRLTRIGAGPAGETVVFGLTSKDKEKTSGIPSVDLFDGKMKLGDSDAFYGEMRKGGRIYVFNDYKEMQAVRQFGHPNYSYTEIGAGPAGETVVYVLRKKDAEKKPEALISQFKAKNAG